jgi:prepilin-type N-terminal cleavage/methylation domain-containing protein
MRQVNAHTKQSKGFTFVEMMVVLGIVAIAFSLALPELSGFVRRNQISSATNELLAAFGLARAEAIKRGAPVVVCASTNGATCATGGSASVWEFGYIVYVDVNADGQRQTPVAAGEDLLRAIPAPGGQLAIQSAGAIPGVRFAPNGMLHGGSAGMRFAVTNPKSPSAEEYRYICIARAGRANAMNNQTFLNDTRFAGCGAF